MTQNNKNINGAIFSSMYDGNENTYSRSIEFFHNLSQKKSAFDEAECLFGEKIEILKKRKNNINHTDLVDIAILYKRCTIKIENIEEYINLIEGNESRAIVDAMTNINAISDNREAFFVHNYWLCLKAKFFENKEIPEWISEAKRNVLNKYFGLIDTLE